MMEGATNKKEEEVPSGETRTSSSGDEKPTPFSTISMTTQGSPGDNNDPRIVMPNVWSDALASPTQGDIFSPAKPMAEKEALHGAGLQKALDRAKLEAKSGRRVSLMLLESASCYEHFGVCLKKAVTAHSLVDEEGGDAVFQQKLILSLSQKSIEMATTLREELGLPLQGYHTNHGETVPAIHQKYAASRQRAHEARRRALLARQKYLKSVQEAEQACSEVRKALSNSEEKKEDTDGEVEVTYNSDNKKDSGNNSTKSNWEQQLEEYGRLTGQESVDGVTHLLSDVKVLQKRYSSLVEKENDAVKYAHAMEAISLEGLEKLEQQRLVVFYDSLVRTFQTIQNCLDELVTSVTEADNRDGTSNKEEAKRVQKKGDFFTTFLKVGALSDTTGVADAETLGLPEELGRLRDEVSATIAARLARVKKVKHLAAFFEDIATASANLGNGLQLVVKHETAYVSSNGTPVEHLQTLMKSCEGPRTLNLWNDLLKALGREAEAFHQFARSLNSIKASKLDHFLLTGEKALKDAKEMDDGRWKHLCDAAKTELRLDAKYQQTTAKAAAARARINSVDQKESASTEKPATGKSPQKSTRAMTDMNKAFGNFLSILPNGGELILTPDARRAVAERNLQEADEKESKGRQALDNAIAIKNKVAEAYKGKAEPLFKKYELEELSGVEDVKTAMESLVASVASLRTSRYESMPSLTKLGENPVAAAFADLNEWTEKAKKDIALENPAEDSSDTTGFMLKWLDPISEEVLNFASIGKNNSFDSFDSNCDKDDGSADPCPATQGPGMGSDRSLNSGEDAPMADSSNGQAKARWLQKSLSAPMAKPAFQPFRKMHSTGEITGDALDDMTEISTVSTAVPPQNSKESFETEFFTAFWPDYEGNAPGVTDSFACAFLPKNCNARNLASIEHGRLFLTHKSAVFVAWRGRKAIIQFSAMVSAESNASLVGFSGDTLLLTSQHGNSQPKTILLGSFNFQGKALEILQDRIETAKKARIEANKTTKEIPVANALEPSGSDSTPLAADVPMQRMEKVLNKKLRGVAVEKFHEIVWADKSPNNSFYGRWLSKGNCFDIDVGEWETSDSGFVGTWCGETYSHKRRLVFKLKRNSMIGPPVAGVTQTQYSRVEGKDRSIMHMTIAFDSIPYSDTFKVEVRWVASRSGGSDISVNVGVEVNFQKSTLLKSQIRSGTLSETKPVHESLFDFVKEALAEEGVCNGAEIDDDDNEGDVSPTEKGGSIQDEGILGTLKSNLPDVVKDNLHVVVPIIAVLFFWIIRRTFWSTPSFGGQEIATLNAKIDGLQSEMKLMRHTIDELAELLKNQAAKKR